MQVILLEKVANLGNLGDVVKVKDGYARNFLIPTRAARRATSTAIKEFEDKRVELEKARRREARRRAGARREDERPHGPHHAEGRRRRPPVRLGHQRRRRRRAQPHRLQGRRRRRCACRTVRSRPSASTPSRWRRTPTWSSTSRSSCSARPPDGVRLRLAGRSFPARAPPPEEGAGSFGALFLCAAFPPAVQRLSPALSTDARAGATYDFPMSAIFSAVAAPPPTPAATTKSRACAFRRTRSRPSRACSAACCSTTAPGTGSATCSASRDFYRYEHRLIYAAIAGADQRDQAGRRDHGVRAAAEPRQGRGLRRPGLPQRAGAERAERRQHPALRRDRARALGAAQARRGERRDRDQRLQSAGPAGLADPRRCRGQDLPHRRGGLAVAPGLPEHGPARGRS